MLYVIVTIVGMRAPNKMLYMYVNVFCYGIC